MVKSFFTTRTQRTKKEKREARNDEPSCGCGPVVQINEEQLARSCQASRPAMRAHLSAQLREPPGTNGPGPAHAWSGAMHSSRIGWPAASHLQVANQRRRVSRGYWGAGGRGRCLIWRADSGQQATLPIETAFAGGCVPPALGNAAYPPGKVRRRAARTLALGRCAAASGLERPCDGPWASQSPRRLARRVADRPPTPRNVDVVQPMGRGSTAGRACQSCERDCLRRGNGPAAGPCGLVRAMRISARLFFCKVPCCCQC